MLRLQIKMGALHVAAVAIETIFAMIYMAFIFGLKTATSDFHYAVILVWLTFIIWQMKFLRPVYALASVPWLKLWSRNMSVIFPVMHFGSFCLTLAVYRMFGDDEIMLFAGTEFWKTKAFALAIGSLTTALLSSLVFRGRLIEQANSGPRDGVRTN